MEKIKDFSCQEKNLMFTLCDFLFCLWRKSNRPPYKLNGQHQSSKLKLEFTGPNQSLEFIFYKYLNKNWKF